jgi:hypothetical protein
VSDFVLPIISKRSPYASNYNWYNRARQPTKIMNTHKVIGLNNGAIALLRQGKHKQAAAMLRTAVVDLQDHFGGHEHGPHLSSSSETVDSESSVEMHYGAPSSPACTAFSSDDDYQHSSVIKANQNQNKPSIISVPLRTEESFAQKDDKTLIFMYAQALVLADVEHCKEVVIAVVLYNMALTMHDRAIARDTSSLLTVALKFYGMSVAIIQGHDDIYINASAYWLLLALYTNMAQIHLSQVCSDELSHCLENIQTLLEADKLAQAIDGDDYAFFHTNATIQLAVVAAPAA